jgi:hypothetical protein
MRVFAMVTGIVLTICPPVAAQVIFDLSGTGSFSQSVDPGTVAVAIENRLLRVRYDIVVRRELIPIAAFAADAVGPLGGLSVSNERSDDPCVALAAATASLEQATSESQVPARRAGVAALLAGGQCTTLGVTTAAKAAVSGTAQPLSPITLRRGERVTVTITRPSAEGQTLTWTLVLSTEPRGEWIITYGVSIFQDRDDRFVSKSVPGGFQVVEEPEDWSLKAPVPSVYFNWLSTAQKQRNWSWSPTVGFGFGGTSPAVFGGLSFTYNQNISFIGGVAVSGQRQLHGRYRDDAVIAEDLEEDQLHRTVYRPTPMVGVALRFDRNPFKKEEAPPAVPAPPAPPASPAQPAAPRSDAAAPPTSPAASGAPEVSRESDVKLRFDAKGAPRDPAAVAALVARAAGATDVFIVSHGWWNDESTADCFYRRIVGGISASAPGYLTPDKFKPLFVTVYWPSALFPMEPSDCAEAERRTESSAATDAFSVDRVRQWAIGAFPDAVNQAGFAKDSERLAVLFERERVSSLSTADADELAGILLRWRSATDGPLVAGDAGEPTIFTGSGQQVAERWRARPDSRAELTLPSLANAKKWLNFGNAFTFWTMKERAGTVGSKGVYEVVKALQSLRTRAVNPVRIHLIGHSFGAKVVTASLTGSGGAANRADSLILLQGAFSQFAFATRDEIRAAGVTVDQGGLYRDVLAARLVAGPIVVTRSSADAPNRFLYPAGVALVNDVTEAARAPRFGSLGANGILASPSSPLNLALQTIANLEAQRPRAISVDASSVILGHSDLIKAQVFKLIWDTVEQGR